MVPYVSPPYLPDMLLVDPQSSGPFCPDTPGSDFPDEVVCKFGLGVLYSSHDGEYPGVIPGSTFGDLVSAIIPVGPQPKVVRTDAFGVVARMADKETGRYGADECFVRGPVSQIPPPVEPEFSVPLWNSSPCPLYALTVDEGGGSDNSLGKRSHTPYYGVPNRNSTSREA